MFVIFTQSLPILFFVRFDKAGDAIWSEFAKDAKQWKSRSAANKVVVALWAAKFDCLVGSKDASAVIERNLRRDREEQRAASVPRPPVVVTLPPLPSHGISAFAVRSAVRGAACDVGKLADSEPNEAVRRLLDAAHAQLHSALDLLHRTKIEKGEVQS